MGEPISQREHFEQLVASLEKQLTARVDTLEANLASKAADMERRLEGMNEFRAALKDQTASFVTREIMNSRIETLTHRLEALEASKNFLAGRSSVVAALATAGLALFVSIVTVLVTLWVR